MPDRKKELGTKNSATTKIQRLIKQRIKKSIPTVSAIEKNTEPYWCCIFVNQEYGMDLKRGGNSIGQS